MASARKKETRAAPTTWRPQEASHEAKRDTKRSARGADGSGPPLLRGQGRLAPQARRAGARRHSGEDETQRLILASPLCPFAGSTFGRSRPAHPACLIGARLGRTRAQNRRGGRSLGGKGSTPARTLRAREANQDHTSRPEEAEAEPAARLAGSRSRSRDKEAVLAPRALCRCLRCRSRAMPLITREPSASRTSEVLRKNRRPATECGVHEPRARVVLSTCPRAPCPAPLVHLTRSAD